MSKRPIIQIKDLTRFYQMGETEVRALNGVTFDVLENEYIAIMGPSGSGKSTLMNMIGCLDTPTGGEYILNNNRVSQMDDAELAEVRNREIGFVFQTFNLLPRTTCLANVELPLIYAGVKASERKERASEVLSKVGLGDRLDHKPNELSGGQRQRVAIARALVNSPSILLADEPTGNLDTINTREIIEILLRINDFGTTVVLVTHNREVVNDLNKRVITLDKGMIISDQETGRYIL